MPLLVLEDGTRFEGEALGARGAAAGEAVFTTSMTGYQEVLTDPSYRGQIVVMAYPLIGNYGMAGAAMQSDAPAAAGFVVSTPEARPSHRTAAGTLDAFLDAHGVVGLCGVDTRRLVRHLRACGTMRAAIGDRSPEALLEQARAVDLRATQRIPAGRPARVPGPGPRVVVVDYGAKRGIVACLAARGADVTVLPHTAGAEQILAHGPDGVVLSNGPGDPAWLPAQVAAVRRLLGRVPLFGICLGHQVLALAAGAATFRLRYGHRGSNHPVRDERGGTVWITTQNHGYAVDEASLAGTGLEVTHRHVHDGTVEGLAHRDLPAWSVQFHPEARPGPRDAEGLFDAFLDAIGARIPAAIPAL